MKFKFLILLIVLSSCTNNPFIGYIVSKEYVPSHMSNETPTSYVEASYMPHYMPHVVIITHSSPRKVNEKYTLFVANKENVQAFHVDKQTFNHYKIMDKVKVYNDTIYKL